MMLTLTERDAAYRATVTAAKRLHAALNVTPVPADRVDHAREVARARVALIDAAADFCSIRTGTGE